ncbi:D-amino acid dehydrogenase [Tistrella mobilis]|uniref:Amino acid dehydrogenase n=1 Tax=Tistrella mobilis TaxID=171437 RepID=A0A162KIP0_9PROT|nr:D-amino acid dehydrogenase [Tistrella mobilis]KYO51370.1 amino acid dehydrogenase [Tistrella mobilis]
MKVVVLGAGVVGIATAWHLADQGHEVTVIDRRMGPGLETSFANGGQISPSHAEPWANPATLKSLPGWLLREDAPLVFRWRADPDLWRFGLRFLANCTRAAARRNTERAWRLARYSLDGMKAIRAAEGFAYDEASRGILHVFEDPKGFDAAGRHAAELDRTLGIPHRVMSPAECVAHEPALAPVQTRLAGGVLSPIDEQGDARLFTARLAERLAAKGGRLLYGRSVAALETGGDRVTAVRLDMGTRIEADAVVAAMGSFTPLLLRRIGIRLPVYPLKGYSVTLNVAGRNDAPQGSLTDDARRIVFTRLGDRLRAAGTAELAGYDLSLNRVRSQAILKGVQAVFPEIARDAVPDYWCGLRPASPDGVPVIGPTRFRNLFLNTGHGTLGWTMAAGSGRLVADLVSGRTPEISTEGLTLDRFRI